MSLFSRKRNAPSSRSLNTRKRPTRSVRPMFEVLEERTVLSGSPPAVLISGPATVAEINPHDAGSSIYRLDLTAVDPEGDTVDGWTINWGDGTTPEWIPGNPSSVTHEYAAGTGPALLNISASAKVDGETFVAKVSALGSGGEILPLAPELSGRRVAVGPDYNGDTLPDLYVSFQNGELSKVNVLDGITGALLTENGLVSFADGLDSPTELSFGPDGNLYVCSSANGKVLKYDWSNGNVSEFISGLGYGVYSLTFDSAGHLYVCPSGGAIWKYDSTGQRVGETPFAEVVADYIRDLEFGPDGNLYFLPEGTGTVYYQNRVVKFDVTSHEYSDFVSASSRLLNRAAGLAFGPDGDLYVTRTDDRGYGGDREFNPRVLKFDGTNGAFLANIDHPQLTEPLGIAFGGNGDIYVTRQGGTIRKFDGPLAASTSESIQVAVLDADRNVYESGTLNTGIAPDHNWFHFPLTVTDSGSVLDVNVTVNITHANVNELQIILWSPSGIGEMLFNGLSIGGTAANLQGTTFDDETTNLITNGTAPFTGTFQPFNRLGGLDGQEAQGTWILSIIDGVKGTKGTLNRWSLQITRGIGPTPPTFAVNDAQVTEGDSGTKTAVFTVTRSGDTSSPASVDYATANGTATAGSDYEATSGTLNFAAGEMSKEVYVTIYGDTDIEPNETFTLVLSNPSGAAIADGSGVGTILTDDIALPTLSISDVTKNEGKNGFTSFTFLVTLSAASTDTVTVNYQTLAITATSGTDYTAASGTLTFAPGETSKTITIKVKGDSVAEPDETFWVELFGATNAGLADAFGLGTIVNDD